MKRSFIPILFVITIVGYGCSGRPERIWPFMHDYSDTIHCNLQKIISVNYKDVDFEDVVVDIRNKTGLNMVVTPSVSAGHPIPTTLELNNVRAGTVIMFVVERTGMPIQIKDDVIIFGVP